MVLDALSNSLQELLLVAATSTQSIASKSLPWKQAVARYQNPDLLRSSWQLVNSIVPYLVLCYLMWLSLSVSYWLTLGLSVLASGFLIRIFIIFHDCGHGSFFKSQQANHFWGTVTGFFVYTGYFQWRHEHAIHHASAGDLDRRGIGDVWTLTTREYLALPPMKRLSYRLFRHPLIMFGVGQLYTFIISHRFVPKDAKPRERNSVILTNVVLLATLIVMHLLIGIKAFILIQLPILTIGGAAGIWLFYVQHQFEGAYWQRHEEWDFVTAALQGSSYYKLPKVLQWFTGNIGIHHIHHLAPRIPNYKLEQCQEDNPIFHNITPITLWTSLRSLTLRLWDEEQQKMLSFRALRAMQRS